MEEDRTIDEGIIKQKGGTWEVKMRPGDVITVALNGVIGKEITAGNWTICQIKTWQQIQK